MQQPDRSTLPDSGNQPVPLAKPVGPDRKDISASHPFEVNMIALEREAGLKEIIREPEDPDRSPKARFGVFGEEMIEKEVKPAGNSGRVYLPLDWVGKHVKIIRID